MWRDEQICLTAADRMTSQIKAILKPCRIYIETWYLPPSAHFPPWCPLKSPMWLKRPKRKASHLSQVSVARSWSEEDPRRRKTSGNNATKAPPRAASGLKRNSQDSNGLLVKKAMKKCMNWSTPENKGILEAESCCQVGCKQARANPELEAARAAWIPLTEGLECISWNQMERLKLDCLTTWWHLDRGIQNWWNVERIHWNHHLISMLTSVMTSICCCIWQKGA